MVQQLTWVRNSGVSTELSILQQSRLIFLKDLRSELRSRAAINSVLLFTLCSLLVVVFAIGNQQISPQVKAALIWVILFFASFSGLSHVFLIEEETGTSLALRLYAKSEAIFIGKLIFNLLAVEVITFVVTPMFGIMLHLEPKNILGFIGVILSGTIALSVGATVTASVIAKANGKGALYGAIGFPVLLPVLMMAVQGTKLSLDEIGGPTWRIVLGLMMFAVMLGTAAITVFPLVWED